MTAEDWKLAGLFGGWVLTLLVAVWGVRKWVSKTEHDMNGLGGRVDKLERDSESTGTLVGRLELDAREAAADRSQIKERVTRTEKAIEDFEHLQRDDTEKILRAVGEVRERVIRVETILEEREE